ncbi:MAG: phosphonopyruvate decarboxylase [Candidatus Heimdallarchaeaceae archaeon]
MKCQELWEIFRKEDITFFTGVPDSTFKSWMSYLDYKNGKGLTNIISCNECEAIALASGYHLATEKIGVVYMQNAGLGKTVNPLTSLADKEVYSIPILLMIGWRGEPGKKDEPQHIKMGRITLPLLDVLEIPYSILPKEKAKAKMVIKEAKEKMKENNSPYAIIIKKETIEPFFIKGTREQEELLSREEAIEIIISNLPKDYAVVSTTGKTSRELFESRIRLKEKPKDFYTVGSMGCTSSISLGIALNSSKKIIALDGDGSVLMQLGSLATIGNYKPNNLYHVIFDNNSYESTGGQPTVSQSVKFDKIALSCGYKSAEIIRNKNELLNFLTKIDKIKCPSLVVVKVRKGSRFNLGRPTTTPQENKRNFMKLLRNEVI